METRLNNGMILAAEGSNGNTLLAGFRLCRPLFLRQTLPNRIFHLIFSRSKPQLPKALRDTSPIADLTAMI
jgi:hypothetical protein